MKPSALESCFYFLDSPMLSHWVEKTICAAARGKPIPHNYLSNIFCETNVLTFLCRCAQLLLHAPASSKVQVTFFPLGNTM